MSLIKKYNFQVSSEINLIPLIDVLLVLILSTITVTSSNVINNTKINLPELNSKYKITQNHLNFIIEVLPYNKFNIIIDNKHQNNISYEDLSYQIHLQCNKNIDTIFLISGDQNIQYKEIIKIIDLLYKNEVKSIGLLTKQR